MKWPEDWPRYKQCDVFCDILEGPCSCGAWHGSGEFQLREGILYRYGEPISSEKEKIMSKFLGVKVNLNVALETRDKVTFPPIATAFGVTVTGLYFSGNAKVEELLSFTGTSVKFPVTIEMPCGWSITVPCLESCRYDLACPCGSRLHWIIKWDRE